VGALNVKGLTDKRAVSVRAMQGLLDAVEGMDVVAIGEPWLKTDEQVRQVVRWADAGGWRWCDHRRLQFHEKEKKGSGGVALMVRIGVEVLRTEAAGEGVLWVTVKKEGVEFDVAAVYAVPLTKDGSRVEMTKAVLDEFAQEVLRRRRRGRRVVAIGDLNARVGEGEVLVAIGSADQRVLQRRNVDRVVNPRGKAMVARCQMAGLVMLNGLVEQAEWTYENDSGAKKSVCDWVCVGEELLEMAGPVRVSAIDHKAVLQIKTDHYLVHAELTVQVSEEKKEAKGQRKRWQLDDGGRREHWEKLAAGCESMAVRWVMEDEKKEEVYAEKGSVERMWQRFEKGVHECLEAGVGRKKGARRERRKAERMVVTELRRKLAAVRAAMARRPTCAKSKARLATRHRRWKRALRREALECRKRESRREWSVLVEKRGMSEVEYWRRLKRLAGKGRGRADLPEKMRDGTGVLRSGEEAERLWTEGWRKLGVDNPDDARFDAAFARNVTEAVEAHKKESIDADGRDEPGYRAHEDAKMLDANLTLEEVKDGIKRMQRNKACGVDDIPNEVFMEGGEEFVKLVHMVLSFIWVSEEVPSDWTKGLVTPLFKDGDRHDTDNYRGITLLCTMGKLFGSILNARLATFCERPNPHAPDAGPRLADEQGGFRATRGCPDQVFALTEVLRKRKAAGKATYCCFIDISKAYDGVFRDGLWDRLWTFGIRGKMWRVLQAMMKDTASSMVINGKKLDEFGIEVGVRQGCVLSPTLFSIFFDGLVRELHMRNLGKL
jgi:hypothetical protein